MIFVSLELILLPFASFFSLENNFQILYLILRHFLFDFMAMYILFAFFIFKKENFLQSSLFSRTTHTYIFLFNLRYFFKGIRIMWYLKTILSDFFAYFLVNLAFNKRKIFRVENLKSLKNLGEISFGINLFNFSIILMFFPFALKKNLHFQILI